MTINSKFTFSEIHSIYNAFRSKVSLGEALTAREAIYNALTHKAKNVFLLTLCFGERTYAVIGHDGKPFANAQQIDMSMKSAHGDSEGSQGSGGSKSGLLLCGNRQRYNTIWFSRTDEEGPVAREAKINDKNEVTFTQNKAAIDALKKALGDDYDDVTVAYFYVYEKEWNRRKCRHPFGTVEMTTTLAQLIPMWLKKKAKITYYPSCVIKTDADGKEDVSSDVDTWRETHKNGSYTQKEVHSTDHYFENLGDEEIEIDVKNCKHRGFHFDCRFRFRFYPGVYKGDYDGSSTPVIRTRGDQIGEAMFGSTFPKYSTSLTLSFFTDPLYKRLQDDPVWLGNMVGHKAATILAASIYDYSYFIKEYREYTKQHVSRCEGLHDAIQNKDKCKVHPFVTMEVFITKVHENEHLFVSDFVNYAGGCSVFFFSENSEYAADLVESALKGLALSKDPKLAQLREIGEHYWPSNTNDMIALPVLAGRRTNTIFIRKPDNTPLSFVDYGKSYDCIATWESGQPIPNDYTFECVSGAGVINLKYTGKNDNNEDEWKLRIGGLCRVNPDKSKTALTEEEFAVPNQFDTWPQTKLVVHCVENATKYGLSCKPVLPRRLSNHKKAVRLLTPGERKEHKVKPYRPMQPEWRYVEYKSGGSIDYNISCQEVKALFADRPGKDETCAKIHSEITQFSETFWAGIDGKLSKAFSGHAENLVEEWGENNAYQYLLNIALKTMFFSRGDVQKKIEKHGSPGQDQLVPIVLPGQPDIQ